MREFFRCVLPSEGPYTISFGPKNGRFYKSIDSAVKSIGADTQVDVYFGLAALKEGANNRRKESIRAFKCFFLDIDCGNNKPYADQVEGVQALRTFCTKTGLPAPLVVSSGYGLHVYWPLSDEITVNDWLPLAFKLRALLTHLNFNVDFSKVTEITTILRVPYTKNFKDPLNPKDVKILKWVDPYPTDLICNTITSKFEELGLTAEQTGLKLPVQKSLFGSNTSLIEKVNKEAVLSKCAALRMAHETRGNIEEPKWFQVLNLVKYLEGATIEEFSDGHPKYSKAEAHYKFNRNESIGPTTCDHMRSLFTECEGCTNKCNTPIALGRPQRPLEALMTTKAENVSPQSLEEPVDLESMLLEEPENKPFILNLPYFPSDALEPSYPYAVDERGIFMAMEDSDSGKKGMVKIYDRVVLPIRIFWDYVDNGYSVEIYTNVDVERHSTISIPTSTFADGKALRKFLGNYGILPKQNNDADALVNFMVSYINRIQVARKSQAYHNQLGWTNKMEFVLPDKTILPDGSEDSSGISNKHKELISNFHKRGTLEDWKQAIEFFNEDGYEHFQFGHCTGYGSLLFKFTGFKGAIVNLVGDTGSGKTNVVRSINSLFGHPENYITKEDTQNARMQRIGIMGSINPTVDEITNIDQSDLSDFCYSISQGREKMSLNANRTQRTGINTWQLLLTSTSNSNLMDKLSSAKLNASAEAMRIFEYYVSKNQQKNSYSEKVFTFISNLGNNYGHAGEIFVKYLMANLDSVEQRVTDMVHRIRRETKADGQERFWVAIVAATVVGGEMAKEAGLINFDMESVLRWAQASMISMRHTMMDTLTDPTSILSQFISNHINNIIVVTPTSATSWIVHNEPTGKLVGRMENEANVMYLDARALKVFISDHGADYKHTRDDLVRRGILLDDRKKKVLSSGSDRYQVVQTRVWRIDMTHPDISATKVRIVKDNLESMVANG